MVDIAVTESPAGEFCLRHSNGEIAHCDSLALAALALSWLAAFASPAALWFVLVAWDRRRSAAAGRTAS
jgi:hypothetical protein